MMLSLCSLGGPLAAAAEVPIHQVRNSKELAALAPLLRGDARADASPLIVHLAAGTYLLTDSVRILRSDVRLTGEVGARLVLADGMNEPVIAVGTQDEVPAAGAVIRDITITGLELDGNMDGQSSETSFVRPWIRNNGIDARAVVRLTVENVAIHHARSGGLVISYRCSDVRVNQGIFTHCQFDGLAFYDSDRVTVTDCTMAYNRAAGVSLDNNFRDSVFSQCILRHNGDVGIFVRNSHNVRFEACVIQASGNWAAFLGHDERDQGVRGIRIDACQIIENRGGVFLSSINEQQSSAVEITRTGFAANVVDGRANWYTCGAPLLVADATEEPIASAGLPRETMPVTAW